MFYLYLRKRCEDAGWVRNPDWITMPTITASDEKFAGLFLVFENQYNATVISANAGNVDIDWGDGTSMTSTGGLDLKEYDYTTLTGDIYVDDEGHNYKQVMITLENNGMGAWTFLSLDLAVGLAKANSTNNYVDILCSLPNVATISLGVNRRLRLCERFRLLNHGGITGGNNQFRDAVKLTVLEFDTSSFTTSASFLSNCNDLTEINGSKIPTITLAGGCSSALRDINIVEFTLITITGVSTYGNALTGTRVEKIDELNMPSAVNLSNMCNAATTLRYIYLDVPLATTYTQLFAYAYALEEVIFNDCSAVTTTTNMLLNAYSLKRLIMPGLTRGVNLTDCDLSEEALLEFANSVGTASGAQTMTVTSNPGAGAAAFNAVLVGKGYTVVI